MINISQGLGCERTIWIRFNPDAFQSPESRKFSTPAKRHAVLKSWLLWALEGEKPPHTISVVHLFFFDEFREGDVRFFCTLFVIGQPSPSVCLLRSAQKIRSNCVASVLHTMHCRRHFASIVDSHLPHTTRWPHGTYANEMSP